MAVLAARPSIGKTGLALAIAIHAARSGNAVLFISLEMPDIRLADRVLVSETGCSATRFRFGRCNARELEALSASRAAMQSVPLWIHDTPDQTVSGIASQTRRLKRTKNVRLVVVDYLQLVRPDDSRAPRHEQVATISRRLKALARETGVAVLAFAQLNREVEGRPDGAPRLSDLRESGSIEADADLVVLLHRPTARPGALALTIAKQRNGPTGSAEVWFDRASMRFRSQEGDDANEPDPFG